MKIIIPKESLDEIRADWHWNTEADLKKYGTATADGGYLIQEEIYLRIRQVKKPQNGQKPLRQGDLTNILAPVAPARKFEPPTSEKVGEWSKICSKCKFSSIASGVLKCVHPRQTCPTCSQGKSGLSEMLKTYSFRCPENLLKK